MSTLPLYLFFSAAFSHTRVTGSLSKWDEVIFLPPSVSLWQNYLIVRWPLFPTSHPDTMFGGVGIWIWSGIWGGLGFRRHCWEYLESAWVVLIVCLGWVADQINQWQGFKHQASDEFREGTCNE